MAGAGVLPQYERRSGWTTDLEKSRGCFSDFIVQFDDIPPGQGMVDIIGFAL